MFAVADVVRPGARQRLGRGPGCYPNRPEMYCSVRGRVGFWNIALVTPISIISPRYMKAV